jgi:hypothetical protein
MMGRGVTFIDWNCKSVAHRSYQRSCDLGRHASSTGEDLRKETADARGVLGVTPKVSTPLRDVAGSTCAALAGITNNPPIEEVCGGRGATH